MRTDFLVVGSLLLLTALIAGHILNGWGFEMKPIQTPEFDLELLFLHISRARLLDLNGAVVMTFLLRNRLNRTLMGNELIEQNRTYRLGDTARQVYEPFVVAGPTASTAIEPKSNGSAFSIMFDDVDLRHTDRLVVSLPFKNVPPVRINSKLPVGFTFLRGSPWMLIVVAVVGSGFLLAGSWEAIPLRNFLLSILGFVGVYSLAYASTLSETLMIFVALTALGLIAAAVAVGVGDHRFPFRYPESFTIAGYCLVALGLLLTGYFAWFTNLQRSGNVADYILLFLSTAICVYSAPSARSLATICVILAALYIVASALDLAVISRSFERGDLLQESGKVAIYDLFFSLSLCGILVSLAYQAAPDLFQRVKRMAQA